MNGIVEATWAEIKSFANEAPTRSIRYRDIGGSYYVRCGGGLFVLSTVISKADPNDPDLLDFDNNFKNGANRTKVIDRSGATSANAGVALEIMAENRARSYLLVQNLELSGMVWIRFGSSDAQVRQPGSIGISPSGAYLLETGPDGLVRSDRVSIAGENPSMKFTGEEG